MAQNSLPLSQTSTENILDLKTELFLDESAWESFYSAIKPKEDLKASDKCFDTDLPFMTICECSCFATKGNSHASLQCNLGHQITEQSTFLNSSQANLQDGQYASCYSLGPSLGEETSEIPCHEQNGSLLDYPINSDLHKALGQTFLDGCDDSIWDYTLGDTKPISSIVACQTEEIENYEPWISALNGLLMNESETEHLPDAVVTNLRYSMNENTRCERSPSSSSANLVGSCLTQSLSETDVLVGDHAGSQMYLDSKFHFERELSASCPAGSSSKSIDMLLNKENKNEVLANDQYKIEKSSHPGKKRAKAKAGDNHRPRPRDRQLIQDRVKELRELVPNGAKCSIDALLDQTIKHMLFLRSLSSHAEKLKSCAKDTDSSRIQAHCNGSTWAYELGDRAKACPIVIENLDQPGHMLVEMLCTGYSFFLEIAQVIRHLKLTILKGGMESRSDKLCARFIIEASRGFHRMDILWPLIQLMQRSTLPTANL